MKEDELNGDAGPRFTFGTRRIEVAAALLEHVDEKLLHGAVAPGFSVELVKNRGENFGDFEFVEAAAAHGVADVDAFGRGSGGRGDGSGGAGGRFCDRVASTVP